MCLYTKRILNRRYLPTKKNGYVPPVCTDERLRYIDIECGECFECKKKKARALGDNIEIILFPVPPSAIDT